jgi:hypothetical protein
MHAKLYCKKYTCTHKCIPAVIRTPPSSSSSSVYLTFVKPPICPALVADVSINDKRPHTVEHGTKLRVSLAELTRLSLLRNYVS